MTELQANEESLRIATGIILEERRRGRRKNVVIIFLVLLNLICLLLQCEGNLAERKGNDHGEGYRDQSIADSLPQTP
jgi:hypothetical protein